MLLMSFLGRGVVAGKHELAGKRGLQDSRILEPVAVFGKFYKGMLKIIKTFKILRF